MNLTTTPEINAGYNSNVGSPSPAMQALILECVSDAVDVSNDMRLDNEGMVPYFRSQWCSIMQSKCTNKRP